MNKGNLKKVNLIPKSFFLLKKLNVIQFIALGIGLVAILVTSVFCFAKMGELKTAQDDVRDANKIIAEADFATLQSLKTRYDNLKNANDAGNFNTIPNIYEDMTDFLACIVKNMPETMSLNSIEGEFTGAGVYAYSFSFSSTERSTIPVFLQQLQNEEILKYVNISAITLEEEQVDINNGNGNMNDVTDDAVTQDKEGKWEFTLVIKTRGGAQ